MLCDIIKAAKATDKEHNKNSACSLCGCLNSWGAVLRVKYINIIHTRIHFLLFIYTDVHIASEVVVRVDCSTAFTVQVHCKVHVGLTLRV